VSVSARLADERHDDAVLARTVYGIVDRAGFRGAGEAAIYDAKYGPMAATVTVKVERMVRLRKIIHDLLSSGAVRQPIIGVMHYVTARHLDATQDFLLGALQAPNENG